MKAILKKYLRELEEEKGLRVVHVAEGGSNAWGYSNSDSDYDIRLIYVQLPWRKSILNTLETIRFQGVYEGVQVDMLGYELRKACQKLTGSDMTVLEAMHSPMVYGSKPEFQPVREVAAHYLNMTTVFQAARDQAKRNLYLNTGGSFVGGDITSKSLIHSLRFSLIAIAAKDGVLEFTVPNLIALYAIRYPWVGKAFEWLTANRQAEHGHLISNPIAMQIYDLFKAVDAMERPEGKRNHDVTVADRVYSGVCLSVLGTFHVTNSDDLMESP